MTFEQYMGYCRKLQEFKLVTSFS